MASHYSGFQKETHTKTRRQNRKKTDLARNMACSVLKHEVLRGHLHFADRSGCDRGSHLDWLLSGISSSGHVDRLKQ